MAGVLFVHNNFPAQFGDLARELVRRGVPCVAIGQDHAGEVTGVKAVKYQLSRGSTPGVFPLAVRAEADLLRAVRALEAARLVREQGFEPDVIIGHTGWGETLLLDEVWPQARQVLYPEFFYAGHGLDIGFDLEFSPATDELVLLGKAKTLAMGRALADADAIVCPTGFQASTLPDVFHPRVRIIHEGVDLAAVRPGPAEPFALDGGQVIEPGTPVITHINRRMEPLRGLHIFARALPRLLAEVPQAQVLVIGEAASRGYSGAAPEGQSWKEICFRGVEVDPARVHFLGKVPHPRMLAALRLSTGHVYYTYPFVLSWSLAEAMASGCHVIASDTAPLREVIQDGANGRLLPFFDAAALSAALVAACRDPAAAAPLRAEARRTAERLFDRQESRALWLTLLREMGVAVPS
jgi:glycosyltransferase involved in cell wall biosynthesis